MEPKESEFTKKINKWLQRTNDNIDQMKYDILNKAMGSDEQSKKEFNMLFYGGFALIFGIGFLIKSNAMMLVTGLILGASFVGWIYANAKSYFQR